MMLADSNVWLALALSQHEFHAGVRSWFARQKSANPVLFCRASQQSFLRLLTTSAVLARYGIPPLGNNAAWSTYERLVADRRVSWAEEPPGLESHWKKLAGGTQSSPKLWMDAYLAAFALAGGYQMVTTDKAFRQFEGLDVIVLSKR